MEEQTFEREEAPKTYITIKNKNKDHLMRRFGECNVLDHTGKVKARICPAEYLYVIDSGKKTKFRKDLHLAFKKKV